MHQASVEMALRRAIEQDEIGVAYQPIVSLATGRIAGVEALVRWVQPDGVEIPAVEFTSVAEEGPLIVTIGARVRAAAFRPSRSPALPRDFRISVNLSAREIEDGAFLSQLQQLVVEGGVAPSRIGFEIPETVLMHDTARMTTLLASLRARVQHRRGPLRVELFQSRQPASPARRRAQHQPGYCARDRHGYRGREHRAGRDRSCAQFRLRRRHRVSRPKRSARSCAISDATSSRAISAVGR